jgi:hypothetical protein
MSEVRTLSSIRALIDRARAHIKPDELGDMMMNDPGTGGYVAAYEKVLRRGTDALLEDTEEGKALFESFEIKENLHLAHTDAGRSMTHRWFSVLATGIDFMRTDVDLYPPLSETLAHLLIDSFALASAHVPDAPLDLVPAICRELKSLLNNERLTIRLFFVVLPWWPPLLPAFVSPSATVRSSPAWSPSP